MLEFDESILVKGSEQAVYDFVSNPLNIPRYQAEVISTRHTGEGRFEETMKMLFGTKVFDCSVVARSSPRHVAFSATGTPLDCRVDFHLEPTQGGVKVRMKGSGRLKGAWRLLTPMMRREVKRGAARQLAAIKASVEGERA